MNVRNMITNHDLMLGQKNTQKLFFHIFYQIKMFIETYCMFIETYCSQN